MAENDLKVIQKAKELATHRLHGDGRTWNN